MTFVISLILQFQEHAKLNTMWKKGWFEVGLSTSVNWASVGNWQKYRSAVGTLQLHIAVAKNMAAAKMAAAKAHQLRLDISVVQNFLPGAAEPEGKEIFEIFF